MGNLPGNLDLGGKGVCFFHPEPPNIMPGVGLLSFSKTLLKAYREAVIDPVT